MKKLTSEEIISKIKEAGIKVRTFAWGDFNSPEGVGEFKEVKQYGGEGQGDTWYSVKYFKDHDVYIRTEGYYQSHYGTDFHYGYGEEVKPVQKTITVYE